MNLSCRRTSLYGFMFWLLFLGRFAIFDPFLTPILTPMTPTKDRKQNFIKNWYHHRISRIKKPLYADFQVWIAIFRMICLFWPLYDPNFDPRDPEKGLKTTFYQNLISPLNFSCQRFSLYQMTYFSLPFLQQLSICDLFDPFSPILTPGVTQNESNYTIC